VTRRARIGLVALTAWGLSGCAPLAPPPPPRLDRVPIEARFGARLTERTTRVTVAEGDYSVWAHRPGGQDPPGVSMRVRLVAPDAFRLRVDALLGTAIDAAARRDTLVLNAPVFGLAAVSDAGADRSSRQDIGGWVWRALSAGWSPPADAWAAGTPGDSTWLVSWVDAGDTLALDVAPSGLPRSVHVRGPEGGVGIRYERWAAWDGVMWPARIAAADDAGRLSVTLQPSSMALKARDPAARTTLRVPPNATRMSRSKLLGWIERVAIAAHADSADVEGR
jgi:hypothetical protein